MIAHGIYPSVFACSGESEGEGDCGTFLWGITPTVPLAALLHGIYPCIRVLCGRRQFAFVWYVMNRRLQSPMEARIVLAICYSSSTK